MRSQYRRVMGELGGEGFDAAWQFSGHVFSEQGKRFVQANGVQAAALTYYFFIDGDGDGAGASALPPPSAE